MILVSLIAIISNVFLGDFKKYLRSSKFLLVEYVLILKRETSLYQETLRWICSVSKYLEFTKLSGSLEKFLMPSDMSVSYYVVRLEQLYFKTKSCQMEILDVVLAYRLLNSANLCINQK